MRVEITDLAPLSRDLALVRRDRPVPLSPAAAHLVAAITEQARTRKLLAPRARAAGQLSSRPRVSGNK